MKKKQDKSATSNDETYAQPKPEADVDLDTKQDASEEIEQEASSEEAVEQSQIEDLHQDKHDVDGPNSKPSAVVGESPKSKWQRYCHWFKTHKKLSVPLTALVVVGVLALLPFTRFAIAGLFLKQNLTVTVVDEQTNKPVSAAHVSLAGQQGTTDARGQAKLHVKVGHGSLSVTKNFYRTASQGVTVPILKPKNPTTVQLHATGRQVPITVINKINGKPVSGATVKGEGSEAKTDAKGQAVLVVSADKTKLSATVSGEGFNQAAVEVQVTTQAIDANKFAVTPSGKIYFLSNQSGKIDVVKTDLDGANRQTVLAGTGSEDKQSTVLLATTDWKYLMLYSKRDSGDYPKLFLIDTGSDKLTTMDEGKANFTLIGWSGHRFVYEVDRTEVNSWEPHQQALKSFNAENGQLATLDQNDAEGDQYHYKRQDFSNLYLIEDKLIYTTRWSSSYYYDLPTDKTDSIRSVDVTGANKKDLKTFDATTVSYFNNAAYEATSVTFGVSLRNSSALQFFEYEDGAVKDAQTTLEAFQQGYPTFLASPGGNQTFWTELRDGKNTLFVGDKDGKNGKQIASLSEQRPFGWFTDNYLLVSKDGSELSIVPTTGGTPFKISDYYKPDLTIRGYGGGYGGY